MTAAIIGIANFFFKGLLLLGVEGMPDLGDESNTAWAQEFRW